MLMDILVLKLEEINNETYELESSIFILYNHLQNKFVLKGKRKDVGNTKAYTYSFDCYSINALTEFIAYITLKTNRINEILYNYNGLINDLNNIEYHELYNLEHNDYEISRHNNEKLSKKKLKNICGFLQNVFNLQY
jgi:hypothetical protein